MRSLFLLLLFSFFSFCFIESSVLKKIQIDGFAQGTTYHITYYAAGSHVIKKKIDFILDQIDSPFLYTSPGLSSTN